MMNEKDREDAMVVLFYSNDLGRDIEVESINLKMNTFVVRPDKTAMHLDGADKLLARIRTEAVKAERERCADRAVKELHKWGVQSIDDIHVNKSVRAAILTAEPDPCEDAREVAERLPLRNESSEPMNERNIEYTAKEIEAYASQVADKRTEELRAENEKEKIRHRELEELWIKNNNDYALEIEELRTQLNKMKTNITDTINNPAETLERQISECSGLGIIK